VKESIKEASGKHKLIRPIIGDSEAAMGGVIQAGANLVGGMLGGGGGGGGAGNVLGNLGSTASQASSLLDMAKGQAEMELGLQKQGMEIQFFAKAMSLVQDTAKACMNSIMK
jgi:hypothetical protein